MAYTLPQPGQVFERDGKRREVVEVHRHHMQMPWIEWKRPGAGYSVNGANILTWHNWAKKATEVCCKCGHQHKVPNA
jgi:hypothetical protein